MGKIYNTIFLLCLSFLVDVYSIYSLISCNFQVVDMMAFDRMDLFFKSLANLKNMAKHIDPLDCPCSMYFDYETLEVHNPWSDIKSEEIIIEVCSWKTFHTDIREMKTTSTYQKVVIGCLAEDGSKTRAGTSVQAKNSLLDFDDVLKTVKKRAEDVVTFLHDGLKANVYSNNDIILTNHIRNLLDMDTLVS